MLSSEPRNPFQIEVLGDTFGAYDITHKEDGTHIRIDMPGVPDDSNVTFYPHPDVGTINFQAREDVSEHFPFKLSTRSYVAGVALDNIPKLDKIHRRKYLVEYAVAPKKQQSFIRDSFLRIVRDCSIFLIKIDIGKPLIDQGPFDCILHKFYGEDWKRQLAEYKSKNPNFVIIDAPEAIERLHNRVSMLEVVSELSVVPSNGNTFGIPKQTVIQDMETLQDSKSWEELKFPVIAKPLIADGCAKSHKMSLVYDNGGVSSLKPPIVLQEFVNHGGVIFKVYIVGEHVQCVKHKSLLDISKDNLEGLVGSSTFWQVSNLGRDEKADETYYKIMHLDDFEMPPQQFIMTLLED